MSFFQSRDGTQLHEQTWPAAGHAARRRWCIVHGYGEHIAPLRRGRARAGAAGFSVRGLDLRGHGQSAGVRGFCNRFDEYLDDLDAHRHARRERRGGCPLFVLGHSFGALVAPLYDARHPTRARRPGATSPYWKLALAVPAVKVVAGRARVAHLSQARAAVGLKGDDVARDPEIARELRRRSAQQQERDCALVHRGLGGAGGAARARSASSRCPCCCSRRRRSGRRRAASARRLRALRRADKTLRMLPGSITKSQRAANRRAKRRSREIVEWLRAHASAAARPAKVARRRKRKLY